MLQWHLDGANNITFTGNFLSDGATGFAAAVIDSQDGFSYTETDGWIHITEVAGSVGVNLPFDLFVLSPATEHVPDAGATLLLLPFGLLGLAALKRGFKSDAFLV